MLIARKARTALPMVLAFYCFLFQGLWSSWAYAENDANRKAAFLNAVERTTFSDAGAVCRPVPGMGPNGAISKAIVVNSDLPSGAVAPSSRELVIRIGPELDGKVRVSFGDELQLVDPSSVQATIAKWLPKPVTEVTEVPCADIRAKLDGEKGLRPSSEPKAVLEASGSCAADGTCSESKPPVAPALRGELDAVAKAIKTDPQTCSKNWTEMKGLVIGDVVKSTITRCWKDRDAMGAATGAVSCLANAVWGLVKPVLDTGNFLFTVANYLLSAPAQIVDSVADTNYGKRQRDFLNRPIKALTDWWSSTDDAENRSSDMMQVVSEVDAEDIGAAKATLAAEAVSSLESVGTGLISKFSSFIVEIFTTSYGCQKWNGLPHAKGSTCLEPWPGIYCASCKSIANIACGTVAHLTSMIYTGKLLGTFMAWLGGKVITPVLNNAVDKSNRMQKLVYDKTGWGIDPSKKSIVEDLIINAIKVVSTKYIATSAQSVLKQVDVLFEHVISKGGAFIPAGWAAYFAVSKDATAGFVGRYFEKIERAFARGYGGEKKELMVIERQAKAAVEVTDRRIAQLSDRLDKTTNPDEISTVRGLLDGLESRKTTLVATAEAAARKAETAMFTDLAEDYAQAELRRELRARAISGRKMTRSQRNETLAKLREEGVKQQGINISLARGIAQQIREAPELSVAEIAETLASKSHDVWRYGRAFTAKRTPDVWIKETNQKIADGILVGPERRLAESIIKSIQDGKVLKYEPRFRPTDAHQFNLSKTDKAVDIANTEFKELPSYWQIENTRPAINIGPLLKTKDGVAKSKFLDGLDKELVANPTANPDVVAGQYFQKAIKDPSLMNDPVVQAAAKEYVNWRNRTHINYAQWPVLQKAMEDLPSSDNERADRKKQGASTGAIAPVPYSQEQLDDLDR